MFSRCLRGSAAVTPDKYECDIIELASVLMILKKMENNGTKNIGLIQHQLTRYPRTKIACKDTRVMVIMFISF